MAEQADRTPFYGTGVWSINLDDYVNLPTLEEIFINLVPQVYIVRRKGKNVFSIQSGNSSIGIHEPLVLLDNIAVFNQQAVMSLQTEKIQQIITETKNGARFRIQDAP